MTKTLKDVNETIELKEEDISWRTLAYFLKYNQEVFIFFHGDGLKSASSFTKAGPLKTNAYLSWFPDIHSQLPRMVLVNIGVAFLVHQ